MKQILAFVILASFAVPAFATAPAFAEMTGDQAGPTPQQVDPFMPIMMKMHAAMPVASGNIDRDFLVGMIPHHQAAVEMAEVELAQGHDPKVKKLARQIIKAQQAEIAQMQAWLGKADQ